MGDHECANLEMVSIKTSVTMGLQGGKDRGLFREMTDAIY